MTSQDDTQEENINLKVPFVASFIVLLAWLLTWFFLHEDLQDRGTFGDMFGSVNALFSGFAFVGVIYAIILQSNELKLQRNELKFTRDELAGQKEQLQIQNVTLKKTKLRKYIFPIT